MMPMPMPLGRIEASCRAAKFEHSPVDDVIAVRGGAIAIAIAIAAATTITPRRIDPRGVAAAVGGADMRMWAP